MRTRSVSAIIAVALIVAIYWYFETQGFLFVCALVSVGCLREYGRLAFNPNESPRHLRWSFHLLAIITFTGVFAGDAPGLLAIVICSVTFLTMALMGVGSKEDLGGVLKFQSLGLLGLLYVGVMPALATRLLTLPNGDLWLISLLAVVFAGDTTAYLVGRKFGKTRLLEAVSPKKSVEGAVGGLVGSGLAGLAMSFVIPGQDPVLLTAAAVVTGIFAQAGDLFESLLKRVADVKDSGTIMPGHGGILDRCDGVYFASPVYYVLVRFLTNS